MESVKFSMVLAVKRLALVVLALLLLTTTAAAKKSRLQAGETEKQQVARRVAKEWIEVGIEQYKRGFYKASKQSLLLALDSQDYLTVAECEKLWRYLRKALAAVEGNKWDPGDYVVKTGSRYRVVVEEKFRRNDKLELRDDKDVLKLPPLPKLPSLPSLPPIETKTKADTSEQKVYRPRKDKDGYISTVNRRRNILRSYTKAVVNDAVVRAQNYMEAGEFDDAMEVIENAERVINENYPYLGDELFRQYSLWLKELTGKIVRTKLLRQRK